MFSGKKDGIYQVKLLCEPKCILQVSCSFGFIPVMS